MRAAVYIVTGAVATLGGLVLASLAAGTTPGLPVDVPLLGWTLFGDPSVDSGFLDQPSGGGVFIAVGLCATGVGLHLVRLGLQYRPQAVETLPRPSEWRPRGRIGLASVNAIIGMFLFVGGIASGARWSPGGFLAGMGLMLGAVAWFLHYMQSLRRMRRPVVRCESVDGEVGLAVARSPLMYCALGVFAVALALPGIAGVLEGLRELRTWGTLNSEDAFMPLALGAAFLLIAVILAGSVLYRIAHLDRLVLTPTRLVHRTRRSSVTASSALTLATAAPPRFAGHWRNVTCALSWR